MSAADRHVFRTCPHCGTALVRREEGGRERPVCPGA